MVDQRVQGLNPVTAADVARTDLAVVKRAGQTRAERMELQEMMVGGDWRSNRVIVRSASDLPAASGGLRQLADNTVYEIVDQVTVAEPVVYGANTAIVGHHWGRDQLIYSGSGGALRTPVGTNQAVILVGVIITAPSGDAFDLNGDTDQFLNFRNVTVTGCAGIGTITGYDTQALKDSAFFQNGTGLTIDGTLNKLLIGDSIFQDQDSGATDVTLAATFNANAVDIAGNYFKNDDATNNSIEVDAAASTGNRARLRGNAFIGDGSDIVGFSDSDVGWDFIANDGQANSSVEGGITTIGNADATTFGSSGTYVEAEFGSGANPIRLERFTRSGNVLTYVGRESVTILAQANIAAFAAAGTVSFQFIFAINGTPDVSTQIPVELSNTKARPFAVLGVLRLNTGDTVELQVRNNDNTTDVTIEDGQLVLSQT